MSGEAVGVVLRVYRLLFSVYLYLNSIFVVKQRLLLLLLITINLLYNTIISTLHALPLHSERCGRLNAIHYALFDLGYYLVQLQLVRPLVQASGRCGIFAKYRFAWRLIHILLFVSILLLLVVLQELASKQQWRAVLIAYWHAISFSSLII